MSLLVAEKPEGRFLWPVSKCFVTFDTNEYGMLNLYYIVWFRGAKNLAMIYSLIPDNYEFYQRLFPFLEHIIKYSAFPDPHLETLYLLYSNTNSFLPIFEFTILRKKNSKSVTRKVEMYFLLYNSTYFIYNTCNTRVYKFNLPQLIWIES